MMNDTTLIILIGLPASGKSTYARELINDFKDEAVWLSSDNIRIKYDYKISNEEVFKIMWNGVKTAAIQKKIIIYDATNLFAKNRIHLINQFKKVCKDNGLKGKVECTLFLQPINVLFKRNAGRVGREVVPEDVIWRMMKQFQFPMKAEGYDSIFISKTSNGKELFIDEIMMMPQDNPHHTMSLGEHLSVAAEKAIINSYSTNVYIASLYHDVGKWFCKEIDDKGIAHYYGHENIGAYMLALHFFANDILNKEPFYNVICLVNYHMRPYVWEKSSRAQSKDKRLFGESFYKQLMDLHYCDEAAH